MAFEENGINFDSDLIDSTTTQRVDTASIEPLPVPTPDDPDLIAAFKEVESQNNPRAVGTPTKYGTAKGVMQLLDSTFKAHSEGESDIFDEEANTKAGTNYLKYLFGRARYKKDPKLAIAAYHAGQGNVDRWLDQYGVDTWDELEPLIKDKAPNSAAYPGKILEAYSKKKDLAGYTSEFEAEEDEEAVALEEEEEETASEIEQGTEVQGVETQDKFSKGYPPSTREPSKLELLRDRIAAKDFATANVFEGGPDSPLYRPQAVGTKEDFARKIMSIMEDSAFSRLSTKEQLSAVSALYSSQDWNPDTGELVKQLTDNIYAAATPDDNIDIPELVVSIAGPPPIINDKNVEGTTATLASWKADVYQALRDNGIKPALLGSQLDRLFKDIEDSELEAAAIRNRSMLGDVAAYSGNVARDIAKGATRSITDPAAAIVRYSAGAVSAEAAKEYGDIVSTVPDSIFGKPANDYLYDTDEYGRVKFDPETGLPRTRITSTIAQGVGQIAAFIAGGAVLKGLTAPLMLKTGMGGIGTLTAMEYGYKESEAEGGDPTQNLVAGLLSAPGGALQSLVAYSIAAKAAPSLIGLNTLNQAKVLAPWMLKNMVREGSALSGQQFLQSVGVGAVLGKNVITAEKQIAAFGMGALGAGMAKGLEAYGAVRADAKLTELRDAARAAAAARPQQLLLDAPESIKRKALPAPETETRTAIEGPAAEERTLLDTALKRGLVTPEEEIGAAEALEDFQKSDATAIRISADSAKKLDPTVLEAMHITAVADQDGVLLTKKVTFTPPEAESLQEVDSYINSIKHYLSTRPSPEALRALIEQRSILTKYLKKAKLVTKQKLATKADRYGKEMTTLVRKRNKLLAEVDRAKTLREDAEIKADDATRQIAYEDLVQAEENLRQFDIDYTSRYENWTKISKLVEQRDNITAMLKRSLAPAEPYLNNISAAHSALKTLLQKRAILEAKAAESEAKNLPILKAQKAAQRALKATGKELLNRRIKLDEAGLHKVPETVNLSKGVDVDGIRVVPYNNKWFLMDSEGHVVGKGFEYFYDAADAVAGQTNKLYFTPERLAKLAEDRLSSEEHLREYEASALAREKNTEEVAKLRDEEFKGIVRQQTKESAKEAKRLKSEAKGLKQKGRKKKLMSTAVDEDTLAGSRPKLPSYLREQLKEAYYSSEESDGKGRYSFEFKVRSSKNPNEELRTVYEYADSYEEATAKLDPDLFIEEWVNEVESGYSPRYKQLTTDEIDAVKEAMDAGEQIPSQLLRDNPELQAYAKNKNIEGATVGPEYSSRFLFESTPRKPLTSNYTDKVDLTNTYKGKIAPKQLFASGQKLLNSLIHATQIFTGGLIDNRFLGFLHNTKNYIKVGRHDDIQTFGHELFHAIDRSVIGKWDAFGKPDYSHIDPRVLAAARDMAETFYGAALTDPIRRTKEGFAVFFQHYVTGQPVRKEVLNWYRNEFAREQPRVYKDLEAFKNTAHQYFGQTAENVVLSKVVNPPSKFKKFIDSFTITKLKDNWYNRHGVIDEIAEGFGRESDPNQLLTKRFYGNYLRGNGLTDSLVRGQVGDYYGNKVASALNLKDTLAIAKGHQNELIAYMVARSALARAQKGVDPGIAQDKAAEVVSKVQRTLPKVAEAAERYWSEWLDHVDKIVAQTGPYGAWMVSNIRKANLKATGKEHGYWIPFQREGYAYVNSLSKLKGSSKSIINPLLTIEAAVRQKINNAIKQATIVDIVTRAGNDEIPTNVARYVREVVGTQRIGLLKEFKERAAEMFSGEEGPEPTIEGLAAMFAPEFKGVSGTDFKVHVIMDGKTPRFFEFDPRLTKAFDDALPDFMGSFWYKNIFRFPAAVLRPAATTFSLPFQVRNTARDLPAAWMFLESQGATGAAKDMLKLLNFYKDAMLDQALYATGKNQNGWFARAARLGVTHSTAFGTELELMRGTKGTSASKAVQFGQMTFNKAIDVLSAPENATRLAASRIFMKEKFGITDPNQEWGPVETAEFVWFYKNVTTNFAKQGNIARMINMQVPFFTARIAELTRLPMVIQRNPKKMAVVAASMLTYGFMHALAHNDEEWYKESQPGQKMSSMMFTITTDGIERVAFIPLATGMQLPWALGQAIGNAYMKDPDLKPNLVELAKAYFGVMSPINNWEDLAGVAGKEVIAQLRNKDVYFNRTIVPPNLQYTDPRIQWNEYSTELAKRVGRLTGVSPLRLDHALRNTVPAAANLAEFMDKALGLKKAKEQRSYNFIVNSLTRQGSKDAVMDRSSELFTKQLLIYRANKAQETEQEAIIRKTLERKNKNISDAKTVLYALTETKDRDPIRRYILKELRSGYSIGKGSAAPSATSSQYRSQAVQLRKEQSNKLRTELASKKKVLDIPGLAGS